jgi:hypothetical protein
VSERVGELAGGLVGAWVCGYTGGWVGECMDRTCT